MLSSSYLDSKRIKLLIGCVVLPLLVHQVLFQSLPALFGNQSFSWSINQPYWVLWYLMSLLFWRLVLPFFAALKFPLLIAVAISLLSGMADYVGRDWSLSRSLGFLPFFIAGHLWVDKQKALELPSFGGLAGWRAGGLAGGYWAVVVNVISLAFAAQY